MLRDDLFLVLESIFSAEIFLLKIAKPRNNEGHCKLIDD